MVTRELRPIGGMSLPHREMRTIEEEGERARALKLWLEEQTLWETRSRQPDKTLAPGERT